MNKKIYIAIISILILVALSQWVIVKMVYSRTINGNFAVYISSLYNLKAATINKGEDSLEIRLEDFLRSEIFAKKLLAIRLDDNLDLQGIFSLKDQDEIYAIVWDNVIKKAWLESLAERHGLLITEEDLRLSVNELENRNFLKQSNLQNFGITEEEYMKRVIEPFILETKTYVWLLENYNDFDGMQKAQLAYESLEAGRDFVDVAKDFSDEVSYAESLLWIKESELGDYLEPVKDLESDEFSKIIIAPGPYGVYYTIWYLDSKTTEGEELLYGVRGIYIKAKTLDRFYDDYLAEANINKIY